MSKRSVPIFIAGCILALAGIAGYALTPESAEAPSPRILMENQGGRVVFAHKAHSSPGGDYGDIACARCHHELGIAPDKQAYTAKGKVLKCAACHGTDDEPDFKVAHQARYRAEGGENACLSCHHLKIVGYSDKWNHKDHWTYASDDCTTCHHSEGTTPSGRMMTNIKPQRCANCHMNQADSMTARTRKDASHETCRNCHEDLFAAGARGCPTCHAGASLEAELAAGAANTPLFTCSSCHPPITGSMDAFHAKCIGCHEEVKKGPGKASEDCVKCHTP